MWQKIQLLDTWVLNTDPYSPQKVEDIAIVSVEKQVMDMMKVRCTQNLVVPLTVLGVFLSTCLFWAGHQPATVQRDLPGQPEEPEAAVQWQRVEGDASCLPMGKPSQKLWLFKLNKRFIMHFGCVVLCRASNPGCVTGWSSRWPSRSLQAPPLSQVTAAFLHAVSTQTSIWRTVFNHFFFVVSTASTIKSKCQMEATPGVGKIGAYKPQCDEQGHYKPMQCWHATGFCWCVDQSGNPIQGTTMRGRPDCQRGSKLRSKVRFICSNFERWHIDYLFFSLTKCRCRISSHDGRTKDDAEDLPWRRCGALMKLFYLVTLTFCKNAWLW